MAEKLTDSRFAVYEGVIALAWADHNLSKEEKQVFHRLADGNIYMNAYQRQTLHEKIDYKATIEEIWPRITEKQDRAFLLNLADTIFHADDEYCESEQSLYDFLHEKHMGTLDTEAVLRDISHLAMQQKAERARLHEKMEAYKTYYSIPSRIGRLLSSLLESQHDMLKTEESESL